MNQSCNILIPDGNSTWAMAVINCLSQCQNYKLFVLSTKKRTPAKFSRFTSYYKYYKKTSEANWLKIINDEIEKHNIAVVVPIAENEIRFFINKKHEISKTAQIIPLPKLEDFETAIDKHKLSVFLKTHLIPHPRSVYIKDPIDFQKVSPSLNFPILVKPLHEKGGDGIVKFNSSETFEAYLQSSKELFIQEYINGYDIDCSVLCLDGKVLTYTIQKGYLPGHNEYVPHLGFNFLKNDAVIEVVKKAMTKLNWTGLAHIDLRYDDDKNDYKIIEINARFWGSLEASKVAGTNFSDLVIQMALGKAVTYQEYEPIDYLRFKGYLKLLKRRPLSIFRTKFMLNNTETKSVLKDPLPTMYRFVEWFGRQVKT